MTLRVVFMGTPDFSVPTLEAIIAAGHQIVACYTRAPRPGGRRGLELTASPVHRVAERVGIPVFTPSGLRGPEAAQTFRSHAADVAVVVAYGLILPRDILDAPRLGCLNLHASLLPRWRGAAPIQRAIMAGDQETGLMVMRMEEGLDTGPVAMTARVGIGADMTAGELHDLLMRTGAELMSQALQALLGAGLSFVPQAQEGVTYAHKIEKTECRIDWRAPASVVHNQIRGLSPFPGAWFEIEIGRTRERIKVLRSQRAQGAGAPGTLLSCHETCVIACGEDAVRLLEVQRAGRTPTNIEAFLRGAKLTPGMIAS